MFYKIFPSEILWRSWVKVAKKNSVPLSQLRVVVRYFIINEASKAVIKDTWAYSDFTRDEKSHRELTDTDPGFFAVLGSINDYSNIEKYTKRATRSFPCPSFEFNVNNLFLIQ